jgi:3-oxoadipate enol-lactonase
MLSNPMGTIFTSGTLKFPFWRISGSCATIAGAGASVANQGPYSSSLGRDALAIMDALGFQKSPLAGPFDGQRRRIMVLSCARERIGRAVLASTAAQIPGRSVEQLFNGSIRA